MDGACSSCAAAGGLAFLNAPQPLKAGLAERAMEFGYGMPDGHSGLGYQWDGVFYIRDMEPVKMRR